MVYLNVDFFDRVCVNLRVFFFRESLWVNKSTTGITKKVNYGPIIIFRILFNVFVWIWCLSGVNEIFILRQIKRVKAIYNLSFKFNTLVTIKLKFLQSKIHVSTR